VNVDWRTIEDKLLRRAAKAESFRELYGGGEREARTGAVDHRQNVRSTSAVPPGETWGIARPVGASRRISEI
jgi:hypothetical protein